MIVFPNCKINLGLHILRKRADGFHELETVFYPIQLHDGLELIQDSATATDISFSYSGISIQGSPGENICVKAYHLLKKDFPALPAVKMHLHKVIPTGAGLGGGSADGAFALKLLNTRFSLGLNIEQLEDYALKLGSDCPFFIRNQACLATGRGEQMEALDLDLSKYRFVLVHPGLHISTAWAFSQIKPNASRGSLDQVIQLPVNSWKEHLRNDFEEVALGEYPELKKIKEYLYSKGAVYASMSGSGSSFFGIFPGNTQPVLELPDHYFVRVL